MSSKSALRRFDLSKRIRRARVHRRHGAHRRTRSCAPANVVPVDPSHRDAPSTWCGACASACRDTGAPRPGKRM